MTTDLNKTHLSTLMHYVLGEEALGYKHHQHEAFRSNLRQAHPVRAMALEKTLEKLEAATQLPNLDTIVNVQNFCVTFRHMVTLLETVAAHGVAPEQLQGIAHDLAAAMLTPEPSSAKIDTAFVKRNYGDEAKYGGFTAQHLVDQAHAWHSQQSTYAGLPPELFVGLKGDKELPKMWRQMDEPTPGVDRR